MQEVFFKYQKDAEMKGYNSLSILCTVLLFGAVLITPAFADKEKVNKVELDRTNGSVTGESTKNKIVDTKTLDDAELARTNISVTGTSIKKPINCVEKNGICEGINQDRVTSGMVAAVSSPAEINITAGIRDKTMMLGGDAAFMFGMGPSSSTQTGGTITSVQPHYEKYLY
jgi:hypothetical protein